MFFFTAVMNLILLFSVLILCIYLSCYQKYSCAFGINKSIAHLYSKRWNSTVQVIDWMCTVEHCILCFKNEFFYYFHYSDIYSFWLHPIAQMMLEVITIHFNFFFPMRWIIIKFFYILRIFDWSSSRKWWRIVGK